MTCSAMRVRGQVNPQRAPAISQLVRERKQRPEVEERFVEVKLIQHVKVLCLRSADHLGDESNCRVTRRGQLRVVRDERTPSLKERQEGIPRTVNRKLQLR